MAAQATENKCSPNSREATGQEGRLMAWRRGLTGLLWVAGVLAWWGIFGAHAEVFLTLGLWGASALGVFILAVVAMGMILPISQSVKSAIDRLRTPTDRVRFRMAITAGAISASYLILTAFWGNRVFWPILHDEFSYLIQAHQLAHGRLWMAAHPLAPFFDSFQLIVNHPVYASAYFPGTALLYVPGIWLHWPAWITSIIASSVVCALLYRITTELVDGVAGWLSVLLLWSCQMFRYLSIMTMPQIPLLLYGLLATLAWLKWRDRRSGGWAMGVGLWLALAAITRPVDGLCFAVPIGLAMLLDLRHGKRRMRTLLLTACGIVPPLALQLVMNAGVTGHLLETPFRLYADRDHPNTSFGFHRFDPAARPMSDLPQKQALYQEYLPLIQAHQPENVAGETWHHRLPLMLSLGAPSPFPLLVILLPLALIGLRRYRWTPLAVLPLFAGLYALYVFFLPHYVLAVAPAIIIGILLGAGELAAIFSPGARNVRAALIVNFLIAGVAIAALPPFDATARDQLLDAPLIARVNAALATLPKRPAIVLFRYDPNRNVHEEPVYNADAAWPDDAPVIRAHDRAAENIQLYRYYAERQPWRLVYRFDEAGGSIEYLGTVADLNASPTSSSTTGNPTK